MDKNAIGTPVLGYLYNASICDDGRRLTNFVQTGSRCYLKDRCAKTAHREQGGTCFARFARLKLRFLRYSDATHVETNYCQITNKFI